MIIIAPREVGVEGRGVNLVIISLVFAVASFAMVASRVCSRLRAKYALGLDDYAIILSLIFSVGLSVNNCFDVDHGYGKASTTLARNDLQMALQSFWATQILYKFTINLTKISILLLYLRVFTTDRRLRISVYCVLLLVVGYALGSIFATIFQCKPVSRAWNKKTDGNCISNTAFWYANAVANILGDCVILILPIPTIYRLQLPTNQKWGLVMIFAVGGFVCATSISRIATLGAGSRSQDPTYGTLNSTIWTIVEANTAIICACLPMLKTILAYLFPSLYSDSTTTNTSEQQARGGPSDRDFTPTMRRRSAPTEYHGWAHCGTYYDDSNQALNRPMTAIISSSVASNPRTTTSNHTSSNASSSTEEIALGSITKTTDINVEFENEAPWPATVDDKLGLPEALRLAPRAHHFSVRRS